MKKSEGVIHHSVTGDLPYAMGMEIETCCVVQGVPGT